jgi:hypothetical protein
MTVHRRQWLPIIVLGLLVLVSCSHRVEPGQGNEPPPTPPSVPVIATGNGEIVGGHLGPVGGRLDLGPGGPSITIPAGTAGPPGLSISLVKASADGVPTQGGGIGPPFRASRPLNPPSDTFIEVSIALTTLPTGCAASGLTLAVERPENAGPANSMSTPALRWEFEPVDVRDGQAVARLSRLWGMRLQFLCGTSSR